MMHRVFVSYSSEDRSAVTKAIVAPLRAMGHQPWYSLDSIRAASTWQESIRTALESSEWFIVVLSPSSVESDWVRAEVALAFDILPPGRILPVLFRKCDPSKCHLKLRLIQHLDFTELLPEATGQVLSEALGQIPVNSAESQRPASGSTTEEDRLDLSASIADFVMSKIPKEDELQVTLGNRRVLVVDDEPTMLKAVGMALSTVGFKDIHEAVDPTEALAQFDRTDFDLVISDIRMPRMNGFEFLRNVLSRNNRQAVIFMTAFLLELDDPDLESANHAFLLEKPFDLFQLQEVAVAVGGTSVFDSLHVAFDDPARMFRILYDCRSMVRELFGTSSVVTSGFQPFRPPLGLEEFDAAFRHKAKDCVYSFAKELETETAGHSRATVLQMQISKLRSLALRLRTGEEMGFAEYMLALQEDAAEESIDLDLTMPDDVRFLHAKPGVGTLLILCVTELVDNAKDVMPEGGKIAVTLRQRQSERAISLKVWNDGPQIDPEFERRMFDEGVSTKGAGRGFGLAIVKGLLRRFRGTIRVVNRNGVAFHVRIDMN